MSDELVSYNFRGRLVFRLVLGITASFFQTRPFSYDVKRVDRYRLWHLWHDLAPLIWLLL